MSRDEFENRTTNERDYFFEEKIKDYEFVEDCENCEAMKQSV